MLGVTNIEKRHRLVRATGRQQGFIVRIEGQAVNLGVVQKGLKTSLYIGAYGNIIAGIIWLTTPNFLNIPYVLLNGIFGIAPVVSSVATDAEVMSKFNLENRGTGSSMIETLHVIFAFGGTVLYSTIYDFSLEIFVGDEATYSTEMFCYITGILAIVNWSILAILVRKNQRVLT